MSARVRARGLAQSPEGSDSMTCHRGLTSDVANLDLLLYTSMQDRWMSCSISGTYVSIFAGVCLHLGTLVGGYSRIHSCRQAPATAYLVLGAWYAWSVESAGRRCRESVLAGRSAGPPIAVASCYAELHRAEDVTTPAQYRVEVE